MVDRPHEINTLTGNLWALAHTLAPKSAFRVLHIAYHVFPDSAAAKGTPGRAQSGPEQMMLSRCCSRASTGDPLEVRIFHIATLAHWTAAQRSGGYTTSTRDAPSSRRASCTPRAPSRSRACSTASTATRASRWCC